MEQKTNRRHFLKNSAAFIGGFFVCPVIVAAQQQGAPIPLLISPENPMGYAGSATFMYGASPGFYGTGSNYGGFYGNGYGFYGNGYGTDFYGTGNYGGGFYGAGTNGTGYFGTGY